MKIFERKLWVAIAVIGVILIAVNCANGRALEKETNNESERAIETTININPLEVHRNLLNESNSIDASQLGAITKRMISDNLRENLQEANNVLLSSYPHSDMETDLLLRQLMEEIVLKSRFFNEDSKTEIIQEPFTQTHPPEFVQMDKFNMQSPMNMNSDTADNKKHKFSNNPMKTTKAPKINFIITKTNNSYDNHGILMTKQYQHQHNNDGNDYQNLYKTNANHNLNITNIYNNNNNNNNTDENEDNIKSNDKQMKESEASELSKNQTRKINEVSVNENIKNLINFNEHNSNHHNHDSHLIEDGNSVIISSENDVNSISDNKHAYTAIEDNLQHYHSSSCYTCSTSPSPAIDSQQNHHHHHHHKQHQLSVSDNVIPSEEIEIDSEAENTKIDFSDGKKVMENSNETRTTSELQLSSQKPHSEGNNLKMNINYGLSDVSSDKSNQIHQKYDEQNPMNYNKISDSNHLHNKLTIITTPILRKPIRPMRPMGPMRPMLSKYNLIIDNIKQTASMEPINNNKSVIEFQESFEDTKANTSGVEVQQHFGLNQKQTYLAATHSSEHFNGDEDKQDKILKQQLEYLQVNAPNIKELKDIVERHSFSSSDTIEALTGNDINNDNVTVNLTNGQSEEYKNNDLANRDWQSKYKTATLDGLKNSSHELTQTKANLTEEILKKYDQDKETSTNSQISEDLNQNLKRTTIIPMQNNEQKLILKSERDKLLMINATEDVAAFLKRNAMLANHGTNTVTLLQAPANALNLTQMNDKTSAAGNPGALNTANEFLVNNGSLKGQSESISIRTPSGSEQQAGLRKSTKGAVIEHDTIPLTTDMDMQTTNTTRVKTIKGCKYNEPENNTVLAIHHVRNCNPIALNDGAAVFSIKTNNALPQNDIRLVEHNPLPAEHYKEIEISEKQATKPQVVVVSMKSSQNRLTETTEIQQHEASTDLENKSDSLKLKEDCIYSTEGNISAEINVNSPEMAAVDFFMTNSSSDELPSEESTGDSLPPKEYESLMSSQEYLETIISNFIRHELAELNIQTDDDAFIDSKENDASESNAEAPKVQSSLENEVNSVSETAQSENEHTTVKNGTVPINISESILTYAASNAASSETVVKEKKTNASNIMLESDDSEDKQKLHEEIIQTVNCYVSNTTANERTNQTFEPITKSLLSINTVMQNQTAEGNKHAVDSSETSSVLQMILENSVENNNISQLSSTSLNHHINNDGQLPLESERNQYMHLLDNADADFNSSMLSNRFIERIPIPVNVEGNDSKIITILINTEEKTKNERLTEKSSAVVGDASQFQMHQSSIKETPNTAMLPKVTSLFNATSLRTESEKVHSQIENKSLIDVEANEERQTPRENTSKYLQIRNQEEKTQVVEDENLDTATPTQMQQTRVLLREPEIVKTTYAATDEKMKQETIIQRQASVPHQQTAQEQLLVWGQRKEEQPIAEEQALPIEQKQPQIELALGHERSQDSSKTLTPTLADGVVAVADDQQSPQLPQRLPIVLPTQRLPSSARPSLTDKAEITTTNWWHALPYAEIRKFLNTIFADLLLDEDTFEWGKDFRADIARKSKDGQFKKGRHRRK